MIDYDIDRRLVVKFTTLTENEEKKITSELISFLYYYYLQTGISKNPDSQKVFEYYNKSIKKPNTIQLLLEDFNVQVDAINYIKETYSMIVLIMSELDDNRQELFINETKEYQREQYLKSMIYLLNKNKENEKVRNIIDYLNKHKINKDNISADYIRRIINKVFELV
jgi:hypothetical protein